MDFLSYIIEQVGQYPYLVVLIGFFLIAFLFPIPEEAVLFTGGLLSAQVGYYSWMPALITGIAGVFITDYWFYILFKLYGRNLLKKKIVRKFVTKENQNKATAFVHKYGAMAVFIVRFIPGGIRNPVFAVCGLMNIPQRKFIFSDILGAVIVVQFSFWSGYYLSQFLPPIDEIIKIIDSRARVIIVCCVLFIALILTIKKVIIPWIKSWKKN